MKKGIKLFVAILTISSMACQPKEKSISPEPETSPQETVSPKPQITSLPALVFQEIYEESDYMDVIFQNLPFSISQEENTSIRQMLRHVDNRPPETLNNNCLLFAQQMFQKGGEIIAEAEIYHDPGCYYYVFTYKGQVYINAMTETGIGFYNDLKKGNYQK